ncbi:restriction endonuclease subunit S [Lactobacillus delbrueckii subsp. bulgaricus]|uniref:restriction endonuclease subunit S n=1 Tax=Lactobacillus delbrueckii TaxID=1584 RepID=UPI0021A669C7|nr:restriction endonuclease subunit S [Lactobacillus delbrueckii]MCT3465936.1 restriction endonuclease subunit S [Lactobacillus delbrueckii subsp. bulgaricus]MCT3472034.1 restriction endonuclease subunit S [Lactobacillus delbrueckii subsp. bulgaricus]
MKDEKKAPKLRFKGFTDDWEERKLGELMDITSVKRIHQSDWTDNGIRFLRARDIVSAAKGEEPSDYLYISEEKYEEYSKVSGKVQIGDLLVTGVGTIGVPMLVVHKDPLYFKDGNIIWFKNKSNIDGNFFYYSFIGMKIQKYIRDVAGIGTVGTYTIDNGKKTPISLPNNEEQQKIGSFFKQLDNTIALHQRKLDLLKEQKKGYLQKMFPKNGAKVPELRFAGFADDWEERKLGNELTLLKDGTHGTHQNVLEGPLLLSAKNIKNGKIIIDEITDRKISVEEYNSIHKKFSLEKGDVLLTIVGSIGETAIIENPIGITFQRSVAYLRPSHTILSQFLFTTINGQKFQMELRKRQVVSAQPGIYLEDLSIIPILIPSVAEQQKIGSFFKKIDDTIALHQHKLDLLKEQKKGFLQKMFV